MLTILKTLLERFANSTSFDDLTDSINQIYRDAEQDPELKGWFSNMNRFIRRCLKEQGYIIQDDSNTEWNKLYDQGQFLLRDRYRDHTNKVTDEIKFLAKEFDNDPQNKAFAQSMNKLFNDLGHDADGKPVSLIDYRGKRVVLYFYPKAATPGCTVQACDFRDNLAALVRILHIEGPLSR